jgi:ATP-dependent helicase HepA
MFTRGEFVWIDSSFDIGKIVAVHIQSAEVCRFHSVAHQETSEYLFARLKHAELPSQTRVYYRDVDSGVWRVGRVSASRGSRPNLKYLVTFPNRQGAYVHEHDLFARNFAPTVDPTETLASFGAETQFFHDRRIRLFRELIQSRAASHGLTGLLSAPASLAPHQLHAVQRVLEDPIQRYFLADEVGLGKTIEAGAIIRQWLIDSNTDRVAVITPRTLTRQWVSELGTRLLLDGNAQETARLRIFSFDELPEIDPKAWSCLVVDEAHHLVSSGTSLEQIAATPAFASLQRLSQTCNRVLFLSATPVIGNEPASLALLNLLDPLSHSLADLEGFRAKLNRREDYARRMQSLDPDGSLILLRVACDELLRQLPDDEHLANLVGNLVNTTTTEDRREVISAVRSHIGDTYRIHQRLIRTRRASVGNAEVLRSRRGPWRQEFDEDSRTPDLANSLEQWRATASAHALALADQDGGSTKANLAEVYIDLLEALGQSTETLKNVVAKRHAKVRTNRVTTFPEEDEILAALSHTLDQENDGDDRAKTASTTIRDLVNDLLDHHRPVKVVVFCSSSSLAHRLREHINRTLGFNKAFLALSGQSDAELDREVASFRALENSAVLIADATGEEGLNLQFAHAIVHCDLPFRPERIEQRIGRLDRFGRTLDTITHCVVLPVDYGYHPWQQWAELLREGFRVFDQSISEVQFVLAELRASAVQALFQTGSLHGQVQEIKARLETERERIRLQYQLDQSDVAMRSARFLHDNILQVEKREDELNLAFDRYVDEALKLRLVSSGPPSFRYTVNWSPNALVPQHVWRQLGPAGLGQDWYTGKRSVAATVPGTRLLRPGSALVNLLLQFLRCDDRGAAFATWRHQSGWEHDDWIGFRVCYVVEVVPTAAITLLGAVDSSAVARALQRRADALFPPMYEILYLDSQMRPVSDCSIIQILEEPYSDANSARGRDYSLASREEDLLSVMTPGALHELCTSVREQSEDILRRSSDFTDRVQQASERARTAIASRIARMMARQRALLRENRDAPGSVETMTSDIAIENSLAAAVEAPHVRLDAIGLYVLSGSPPPSVGSIAATTRGA